MDGLEQSDWYQAAAKAGGMRRYAAGETINFQGELSHHVGIITMGRAQALSVSQNGMETWLGHFEAGDFFGHISLLTDMAVNFEISAQSEVTALIIPIQRMRDIMLESGAISAAINKDLALRLDLMMRRLVEALTLSAKGRICAELVRLSRPIGIDPDKHVIRPNPVFVDIALRVSSTRETVSRTVSELQKKGIISREPGALIVQSPQRLKGAVQ